MASTVTLIKARCPRVSAVDYGPGAQTSSERESQKESCKSLDQIRVHCGKENRNRMLAFLGGLRLPKVILTDAPQPFTERLFLKEMGNIPEILVGTVLPANRLVIF